MRVVSKQGMLSKKGSSHVAFYSLIHSPSYQKLLNLPLFRAVCVNGHASTILLISLREEGAEEGKREIQGRESYQATN